MSSNLHCRPKAPAATNCFILGPSSFQEFGVTYPVAFGHHSDNTNSQHLSLCTTRGLLALYPNNYRLSFDLPHASFAIVQGCGWTLARCFYIRLRAKRPELYNDISHGWSLSILGLMRLGHEWRHVHMFIVRIGINYEIVSIITTIPCHLQTSSITLRNAQTPWRDEISTFWQRFPSFLREMAGQSR